MIEKKQLLIELKTLYNWFKIDYPKFEQMFVRREYLDKTDSIRDVMRKKQYLSLTELYEEAEIVAARIKEIRKLLEEQK